jgi:hypothetical protein
MGCIDVGMLLLLETNLTNMIHILKIIAVIILITYSLQLVNAQSDLLVFGGLASLAWPSTYS